MYIYYVINQESTSISGIICQFSLSSFCTTPSRLPTFPPPGAESARLVRDMGDAHFRAPLGKEQLEALKILAQRKGRSRVHSDQ